MATQELISQLLGKKTVSALSETSGAESNQVTKLVTAALPILLAGMQNNAGTDEGAQSLAKALDQHAADDTADVAKAVKNADAADGKKIVKPAPKKAAAKKPAAAEAAATAVKKTAKKSAPKKSK